MNHKFDISDCWINGRTLNMALVETGAKVDLPKFSATSRVSIDPQSHAYVLGNDLLQPFPFSTGDGVMLTVRDMGQVSEVYEFANFKFTPSAFQSAMFWLSKIDNPDLTGRLELTGARLRDQLQTAAQAATVIAAECCDFSNQVVVDWGRGGRVWGNLNRFHTRDALGESLQHWLSAVASYDDGAAIRAGMNIKGLGVSFASKHLRFWQPERFAVLDDVLSQGLGYALNEAGYLLFMKHLRSFKKSTGLSQSLAQIEAGIFYLVRQSVRGLPPEDSSVDQK